MALPGGFFRSQPGLDFDALPGLPAMSRRIDPIAPARQTSIVIERLDR
jgi:hypothetical protein